MQALNDEAGRQGVTHRAVIMIELGDLREGILPGHLLDFYQRCFELPHLEIVGIGANLGCLERRGAGRGPTDAARALPRTAGAEIRLRAAADQRSQQLGPAATAQG